jgi:hypothetical protein
LNEMLADHSPQAAFQTLAFIASYCDDCDISIGIGEHLIQL